MGSFRLTDKRPPRTHPIELWFFRLNSPDQNRKFDFSRTARARVLLLFLLVLGREIKSAVTTTAVLLSATVSAKAFAFEPVSRPWRSTPERALTMVRDVRDDRAADSVAISALSLSAVSFRANGAPAVLWSEVTPPRAALSAETAEYRALELASSLAPDLSIEAGDLFVLGSTPISFSALERGTHEWISVTLGQSYKGLPIPGAVLVFVFREGNLASIRNDLAYPELESTTPAIDAKRATRTALGAATQFATSSILVGEPSLEIWVPSDAPSDARLSYAVKTRSMSPRSELTFHVDALTGALLAGDDQIRYADGEGRVRIVTDILNPTAGTAPYVAKGIGLDNGAADNDGETLQTGPVQVSYDGPYATVSDQAGQQLETFNVQFSGPYKNYDVTPTLFSQADPFVHIMRVKEYVHTLVSNMPWLDTKLTINVNLNDTCNAYWDGQSVNFFRAGNGCANTGRVSGVVYHEFGHGMHQYLTNNVVGSIGEGTGDFLATLMQDTPVVGAGFSTNGAGVRRIDEDKVYPTDVVNEVHEDGLIWASALWDLRTAMETKHGAWAGKQVASRDYVLALTQGPGLTTAYPSVIAADDDDNNPANGTPNSCEINAVFNAHGLVSGGTLNHTLAGTRSYAQINHSAPGEFVKDAGAVTIVASVENRSTCGTVDAAQLKLKLAHGATGGSFTEIPMGAQTPAQGSGSFATVSDLNEGDVFRYYFEIVADGVTYQSGDATAPHLGVVKKAGATVIKSENFENGFGTWTHGSIGSDRVDDWEVAAPLGLAFDPFAAHAGAKVAGTDLGSGGVPSGTDGVAKRRTYLESAPISTAGKEDIRLELWQHNAIDGTLRIKVDGTEVWSTTGNGSTWSEGWRFVSLSLGDAAKDKAAGIVVRFEVEANTANVLGGWSLDDIAITGVAIPPPPPPPDDPKDPPPPTGGGDGTGNGDGTGMGNGNGGSDLPPDTAPDPQPQVPDQQQEAPSGFVGAVHGACSCVATPKNHEGFLGLALLLVGLALTIKKR